VPSLALAGHVSYSIHSLPRVACYKQTLTLCYFACVIFLQVDGFRFDIMGHHFVHNMTNIRNAINALTPERDGVDGRHLYIYGEAWDFGEVALNQRGRNASQHNLGGSRIGAFNDR
jgi:pullulanase/glycogen debranching enzyme